MTEPTLPKKGDTGTYSDGVESMPVRVTEDVQPKEDFVKVVPRVRPDASPLEVPKEDYTPDSKE